MRKRYRRWFSISSFPQVRIAVCLRRNNSLQLQLDLLRRYSDRSITFAMLVAGTFVLERLQFFFRLVRECFLFLRVSFPSFSSFREEAKLVLVFSSVFGLVFNNCP